MIKWQKLKVYISDIYVLDSKYKSNKRKLNVVGYINIKNFSWHQGPSIEIARKEMQGKSVFKPIFSTHLLIYTPLLTLRKPLMLFFYLSNQSFSLWKCNKNTDRFLHILYFIQRKYSIYIISSFYTLFYSSFLFSFHNIPWKSFWISI